MPTHTLTCAIGYTGCPRLLLNRGDGLRFCRGRGRQSGMSEEKASNTALPAEEIAPAQLPCTSCQGKGRLPHTCPSGAVAYYVCPECAGSGVDGGEH